MRIADRPGMRSRREEFTRGSSAIVGAATFGIGESPGWSAVELAAMAAVRALADAGLQPRDVDAVFACLPEDVFATMHCAEHLGIQPRLTDNNRTGGSAFMTHVIHAAAALQARACDVALIMYGSNQRSSVGKLVTTTRSKSALSWSS